MRILLFTSEEGSGAGGLALHCSQLKEIYENLGHSVYIEVVLKPNDLFVVDGGYDPKLGEKLRSSYMIKQIVKKYEDSVDLCISCGAGRTAYYAMLFAKKEHLPLYIVLCGSEINLAFEQTSLAFYNTEALTYATKVIGLSKELNDNARLLNRNDKCKYYIIPNYTDFRANICDENLDENRVIYVAGSTYLGEKKGIANLIKAFSILVNDKGRDDLLYLYGKIDEDLLLIYNKLIKDNRLTNHVKICGYLDRQAFHDEMSVVNVYVQASPFEGFGNSVIEAINMGKDILISDSGYIAEVIREDFSKHIFNSLCPEEMAELMFEYSTEIRFRNDAKNIREKLSSILGKDSIVKQWRNVLSDNMGILNCNLNGICRAVMFHDIDCSYSGVDYAKEGFIKFVKKVYDNGLKLCSMKEFLNSKSKDNLIVCTFDDAYENVYRNAYPIMKEFEFTATVYVCPDLIGLSNSWNHKDEVNRTHMNDAMLVELVSSNWEIGSHGLAHMNHLRLSEHELDKSLNESKLLLEKYGQVDSFCYPYGAFNDFIKNKVKKYYKNAFSVSIGGICLDDDLYQLKRMTPEEFLVKMEQS